jgi:hypothetical protein
MLEDFFAIIAASYTDAELEAALHCMVRHELEVRFMQAFNSDYVCWRDRVR